ncbi:MAG: hypothetical protein AB7Q23_14345 [Hyphomonadaceae bacterium]
MRKLSLLAAAAAASVLAGCGLGAPTYPQFSETSYRIEGNTTPAEGGPSTRTVIYRDGPKMRVEAVLPQYGQAAIVFDESTNAAYVLNPTTGVTRTTTTAPSGATTTPQGATTTAPPATTTTAPPSTTTTTTATPAGVAVRLQDANAPQPLEAAWAALGAENARSTGRCEVAGEQGREWTPRAEAAPGVQRTACITDDGIVLRVRENDRVLWEATALQRGAQNPALFGVPPGYQLIDPQAVADQVGQNLEQLDSVTGQQQPAPAPPPQR